jgi:serine/threonine protein kinase
VTQPTDGDRRVWGGRWTAVDARPLTAQGQGAIWRVFDNRETPDRYGRRTQYALKELRYSANPGSTKYERFVREIEQTAKLGATHDGIVRVIDHGNTENAPSSELYFVMPLAETSLDKARDLKGHLEQVLEIGVAIADALSAAHATEVIHRDVKPGNILLYGDARRPAVTDFGICFILGDERLTGTEGETVGSKDFVAPELQGGGPIEAVGPRADVYSLGKTLYAATSGGDVFPRETHRQPKWNLTTRFSDSRMDHLHGLLDRMCTEELADRFATMAEARDELKRALSNVRQAVPYAVGTYGGQQTAVERLHKLTATIALPAGVARDDAIRRAMDEGLEAAAAAAEQARKTGTADDPANDDAIVLAADHQLSVGLALLAADDVEYFAEWLGIVIEPIHRNGPQHHSSRSRSILRATASLTLHVVAAAAWRLRRWRLLRAILVEFNRNSGFNHLDRLEGKSTLLFAWLCSALRSLRVAKRFEPAVVVDDDIAIATGLAALFAIRYPAGERLGWFSGFVPDAAARWVPGIARTARMREAIERAMATVLMDQSPSELRAWAAGEKQRILGMARDMASARSVDWNYDLDPAGEWDSWTKASSS